MKKEVIIAIFIGVFIGLVITFGLKRAEKSLNSQMESPQAKTITPALDSPQTYNHNLYVASPQPNAIIATEKITLSGSTTPYALIAALTNHDQNTTMADMQGNFSLNLTLLSGANLISVLSYDNQGNPANATIPVIYTSSDIDTLPLVASATATPKIAVKKPTPSPTLEEVPVATTGSTIDLIKDNVKRRIQDVVKDKGEGMITKEKIAFLGTLKSRTSNTLSIQTNTTIKLASISATTRIERNPPTSSFTFDDIALDDYLIALGYEGDGEVLDARKIIVEKVPPTASKYQVAFGNVVEYSTKNYYLTLTDPLESKNRTFLVSRKATLKQAYANDVFDTYPRNHPLTPGLMTLLISLPGELSSDDVVTYQVIFKTNPISAKDPATNDTITPPTKT